MKKWFLIIMACLLCVVYTTGCGSLKTGKKGKDDLAGLDDAAIRGEDIPLDEITVGEFIEPENAGIVGVFEDIYFDYDKSRIREVDYITLNRIGDWLDDNSSIVIMVEGHCDERGSNEYNMALGEQRALSARRYIINRGVDSSRVHTVSYGEENPINSGHNESAWSENRRGHFLVGK